jgi:chromosome segregation ATPase
MGGLLSEKTTFEGVIGWLREAHDHAVSGYRDRTERVIGELEQLQQQIVLVNHKANMLVMSLTRALELLEAQTKRIEELEKRPVALGEIRVGGVL